MNDEGIAAILGLVLMTQPDQTVEIPYETVEAGLPENSRVRVVKDPIKDIIRVTIEEIDEEVEQE